MSFRHFVLAAVLLSVFARAEGFNYLHKNDPQTLELIENFFNRHDADFDALRAGQNIDLKATFASGLTSDQNVNVLISAISGYSVKLASLKLSGHDAVSCTKMIADEIQGKVRWGKELLTYRLSRRDGLMMDKPEHECTCTLAKYNQELNRIRVAVNRATVEYCGKHKKACQGFTSNLRGTIFSTIPNLVFKGFARIAGGDPLNAEELADLGVRCQEVFNGVTKLVLEDLANDNTPFACMRWGEVVVLKSGAKLSDFANRNHVLSILMPFHFIKTPNARWSPNFRDGIVLAPNDQSPADPQLSAWAKKIFIEPFDPWLTPEAAQGGLNAITHLAGKDVYFLQGISWRNNKCEDVLARQRQVDAAAGQPFDPLCFLKKFPELSSKETKEGAAALDREYYCPESNPSQPARQIQCPNNTNPTPKPTTPPAGGNDGSCQQQLDLPECTYYPWIYTYLDEMKASATCSGDLLLGSKAYCRLGPNTAATGCGPTNRLYGVNEATPDDISGGYLFYWYGTCKDLAGVEVTYCTTELRQYNVCQAPPPPPDGGGGGGGGGCNSETGEGCCDSESGECPGPGT